MQRMPLVLVLLLAGCTQQVDVAMFSYQACRQEMTREFIKQGAQPVAANMKAKAYCQAEQDAAKRK
jgi:hypothetical protein